MVNNTAATFSACDVSIILILTLKNENSQDASFVVIGVVMTTFGFCDNVQLDIKFVVWQNIFLCVNIIKRFSCRQVISYNCIVDWNGISYGPDVRML